MSLLIFIGVAALPGDAAQAVLGRDATPARVIALRHQYGLDRSIVTQYVDWFTGVLKGDLGRSLTTDVPVSQLIGDKLRNSALLTACAVLLLVPLSVTLGVLSALWRERWFDYGVAAITLTFLSTPEFVVGTVLIVVFAFGLDLLPGASILNSSAPFLGQLDVVILPVMTLVLVAVAQATRMIRATMIEVLRQDYVATAILRGVPRRRVLFRHALPNAFDATAQILALTVGWLVSGVIVTETLFQFPGVGSAFAGAVSARDLPTVQAMALIVTAVFVVANLFAELWIVLLNPRLRRSAR
ncbi:MAG: ABC transporter permease [Actinobacteria bacterium]|nr:ABC transporter permease [Actinomycetota bacterium]